MLRAALAALLIASPALAQQQPQERPKPLEEQLRANPPKLGQSYLDYPTSQSLDDYMKQAREYVQQREDRRKAGLKEPQAASKEAPKPAP